MPSVQEVWKDPEFLQLPSPEKIKVMQSIDTDFAGLPSIEQVKVINGLSSKGSTYFGDTSGRNVSDMEKEWIKQEGTLETRVRNSSPARMLKNVAMEVPRLAQEMVTMPINAGIKSAYGLAGLGNMATGGSLADTTKMIENRPQLQGPMDPSMTGQVIGSGLEQTANSWEDRTGNTGIPTAAVTAAGDIAALVGGGKALVKTGGGLADLGRTVAEKTRPVPTELQNLSAEHNVPLTFGSEANSPTAKFVESKLARLPVIGTRGAMKAGGEALATAAKNIADEFATASEDPALTLVDRFKSNLKRGKEQASEAYAKVGEELAANGDPGAIDPIQTRGNLKSLLAQSPDIFERLPGSQNRLKTVMSEIVGDTAPKTVKSAILDENGKPYTSTQKVKLSYDDYTWLRGQLGEYIDRAHSSAGAVGSNELRQLTIIKKALDNDFYRWGKDSGYDNVTQAVDFARSEYKTKVAPFENIPVLKSVVNDKFTPEQVLDAIAKPGQATLATRAMKGLTESDKAIVQDAIMRRALAIGLEGAKEGTPISGAKLATFFEKMDTRTKNAAQTPMDVFFSPEGKQRVMGFAKLSRAAEAYGQYAANPLNGSMGSDFVIPGSIATAAGVSGVPAAAAAAAFTKAMSFMLTNPRGKALLNRAYRLPEGATAAWKQLVNQSAEMLKDERGLVGRDINAIKEGKLIKADPNKLEFREEMQNRTASLRNIKTKDFSPITAIIEPDGTRTILDGHNRAAVAKERGQKVNAVGIIRKEYDALIAKGYDDMEIAYAALYRAERNSGGDISGFASELNDQFRGAKVGERGIKAYYEDDME